MANNYFTAAQAREAAEKKFWINLCNRVNQTIIEAYEKGKYGAFFKPDDIEMKMLDRMYVWLVELGYNVQLIEGQNRHYDLGIYWEFAEPVNEDEHPRTEYLTPLRAIDAKKYSDEHSKRELTLKEILDKVSALADVGIYRHTFPLASFCEHNAIRPSTVDRLWKLGYDVQIGKDKLEVHWIDCYDADSENEIPDAKYLLTAYDACCRADQYNYRVVEEIEDVLNVIHDKSTNEGSFELIGCVSYPETLIRLEKLGYKVTVLPTGFSGYKIKIHWGK